MSDFEPESKQEEASVSVVMVDVPYDEDDEEEEEDDYPTKPKEIAKRMVADAEMDRKTLFYDAIPPKAVDAYYKQLKDFQN